MHLVHIHTRERPTASRLPFHEKRWRIEWQPVHSAELIIFPFGHERLANKAELSMMLTGRPGITTGAKSYRSRERGLLATEMYLQHTPALPTIRGKRNPYTPTIRALYAKLQKHKMPITTESLFDQAVNIYNKTNTFTCWHAQE